jgi:hypothetical protein
VLWLLTPAGAFEFYKEGFSRSLPAEAVVGSRREPSNRSGQRTDSGLTCPVPFGAFSGAVAARGACLLQAASDRDLVALARHASVTAILETYSLVG